MPWQQRSPLLVRIGDGRFHPSFSESNVFCDKVCQARRLQQFDTHSAETTAGRFGLYFRACKAAPHILIVDDHREIRDLVSRALTKEGFRVSAAADGRAMRKVLADSRIDLILLDLMLPGEDGLSLCRALRAESNIPIIMLTAKGDEVDRVIGLEMGADDYLPKPFGSRELIARIKAVLRRSRDKAAAAKYRSTTQALPFRSLGARYRRARTASRRRRHGAAQHRRIRSADCLGRAAAARAEPRSAARSGARSRCQCARPQHRHAGQPPAQEARASIPAIPRSSRRCGAAATCSRPR